MDGIENVDIADLHISALKNESPLVSLACGDYDGPNNGGQPNQLHYYCVNVSEIFIDWQLLHCDNDDKVHKGYRFCKDIWIKDAPTITRLWILTVDPLRRA